MDRVEHHAAVAHIMGPDAYALENAERVLNGALQLLRFRPDALPLGFIDAVAPAGDLSTHRTLLLARKNSDPALHLVAVDSEVHFLGSFAARRLELHTACAWKTAAGTIDLVAEDHEHI
jgi:hypothetical protein